MTQRGTEQTSYTTQTTADLKLLLYIKPTLSYLTLAYHVRPTSLVYVTISYLKVSNC